MDHSYEGTQVETPAPEVQLAAAGKNAPVDDHDLPVRIGGREPPGQGRYHVIIRIYHPHEIITPILQTPREELVHLPLDILVESCEVRILLDGP